MKTLYLLLILAVFAACAPAYLPPTVSMDRDLLTSRNWKVAVLDLNYEFEGSGAIGSMEYLGAGKDGGKVVAGILAANLAELPNITIVERGQIAKVLEEAALQQSGVADTGSVVRIGRLLGADAVITGDLTDYVLWEARGTSGTTISFSIRMIDTDSGRVLLNASITRPRPLVDTFANVQMTCKELVDDIRKR
jgi:curli biogenesis system outer membrane secretion channel CsgG